MSQSEPIELKNLIAQPEPPSKVHPNALSLTDTQYSLTQVKDQMNAVQQLMKEVMRDGEHYGKIPGCGDKKVLFKPGAELLSFVFKLAPFYSIEMIEMKNGHREYKLICSLRHTPSGIVHGQGVGSCSTMESQYRYRWVTTNREVPQEYWKTKTKDPMLLGGPQYKPRKANNKWYIFQYSEHDNPADNYNTVLKMAKKRAHVDAILTVTAASDAFTQDIEENANSSSNKTEEKTSNASPLPIKFDAYLAKIELSENLTELESVYAEAFQKAKDAKDGTAMTALSKAQRERKKILENDDHD